METSKSETGVELLTRLGKKHNIRKLEPTLFPLGIQENCLYEFYGKEGCGKSQALLHLLANCILPSDWRGFILGGCGAGAVLIDTDYHFSMVRFASILEHRIQAAVRASGMLDDQKPPQSEDIDTLVKASLKRLYYVCCNTSVQLLLTLHSLKSHLGSHPEICLLVIDSISAFYWQDCTEAVSPQEVRISLVADVIQELECMYNLTVFASKSALFEKKTKDKGASATNIDEKYFGVQDNSHPKNDTGSDHFEFMGKAWSKIVVHRLIFRRSGYTEKQYSVTLESTLQNIQQKDKVLKSVKFVIEDGGLQFS